jgi:hypothetical protein
MKVAKTGAFLATAVGLMFMANIALVQENATAGAATISAQTAKVKCLGANSCKGKSSCKSAQNDCKGQNACKGNGWLKVSREESSARSGRVLPDKGE